MTERTEWRHQLALPAIFADGLPAQAEGQFPTLIADVIEEAEDASPPYLRVEDRLGIRTDLMPEPGRMVLATGYDGKRYRRLFTMSNGSFVLRDLAEKEPDVRLTDIAAIEGLIIGRDRRRKGAHDERKANIAYSQFGLTPEDL